MGAGMSAYSSRVITLSPSAFDAIPQLGKRQCVNTKAVSPVAKASRCHWFEESLALFLAVHLSLAPSLLVPYVSSIETQNTHLSLLHPLSVPLSSAHFPTETQVSFKNTIYTLIHIGIKLEARANGRRCQRGEAPG